MPSKPQQKKRMTMQPPEHFFIRENNGYIRIEISSIIYMEAQKNYVRVVTSEKYHLVLSTLTNMEELLAGGNIIRVHRSFLINLVYLSAFNHEKVKVSGFVIPVTENYYKSVEKAVILIGKTKPRIRKKSIKPTANALVV